MLRQLCVLFKQTGLRHSGPDLIEGLLFPSCPNDQQPARDQSESPCRRGRINLGSPHLARKGEGRSTREQYHHSENVAHIPP
jgi:hypothetical protein